MHKTKVDVAKLIEAIDPLIGASSKKVLCTQCDWVIRTWTSKYISTNHTTNLKRKTITS